jgi:hypothetical protein
MEHLLRSPLTDAQNTERIMSIIRGDSLDERGFQRVGVEAEKATAETELHLSAVGIK